MMSVSKSTMSSLSWKGEVILKMKKKSLFCLLLINVIFLFIISYVFYKQDAASIFINYIVYTVLIFIQLFASQTRKTYSLICAYPHILYFIFFLGILYILGEIIISVLFFNSGNSVFLFILAGCSSACFITYYVYKNT